ncbi:MAG: Hemerythrin domain protein [uncultured Friedmanniella sp.]|uniref:Hemerythrin domain protein n=1 Tax=uncultured Friedmanniella sp. TaxID=335381 RepID=A0A6J4KYU7_9ACTN|nr:MAG: Hemerythrin domain protein [uncultured Friedmanniella sp.]
MTATTSSRDVPQIMFPGQAAAPAGPVDLLPMYLMHHAFRRDLRRFAAAAAGTPVGDRATWRALGKRWDAFGRTLHHHHHGEDETLWPLLLARVDAAGDEAGRATLEAMETEHEEIDPLLESCHAGFVRMAEHADTDAQAALVVRLSATRERLGHHLCHEETEAMALVQKHVSAAEWHALDDEFRKHYTAQDQLFALPWVLSGLPADVAPRVMAFIGTGGTLLWTLLRRRFERRERAAFRYA